jgi:FkbM family methyltransferase
MIRNTKQLTQEERAFYTKIESELNLVFDVGAMNSFFNQLNCEVHFFEPQLARFKELVQITKQNHKYYFQQIGCGNETTEVKIFNDLSSTEWRDTPTKFGVKNKLNVETIRLIRLDEYINTLKQTPKEISLLKLDIEGAEYSALLGMGDMLNLCKYITFEYAWDTSEPFNFKLQDIIDLLCGFDIFKMVGAGLTPINILEIENKVRPNNNNLVAIRRKQY